MIRKKGAPYQTLTRITAKRAQYGSPSQVMVGRPIWAKSQLNAEYEGSNSQNQASVLIAGGITQGMSSMPRHLRCPFAGTLCTKCATQKPISALNTTAVTAKMHDCFTTIQKRSRLKRKSKFPRPTKRSIDLLSVARYIEYIAGYTTRAPIRTMSGSAIRKAMVDLRRVKRARPPRRVVG